MIVAYQSNIIKILLIENDVKIGGTRQATHFVNL